MALSEAHKAAFEAFWTAYPKRPENPKAPARDVFARRILAGVDPLAMVAAAGRYAAACAAQGKDPKCIPHARTWLAQKRYEDFLEAAPASADLDASGRPAGAGDQPSPEPPHPLDFLRAAAGDAAWASWIAPLDVRETPIGVVTITARTAFALDQVRSRFGRDIEARFDALQWAVARKESA